DELVCLNREVGARETPPRPVTRTTRARRFSSPAEPGDDGQHADQRSAHNQSGSRGASGILQIKPTRAGRRHDGQQREENIAPVATRSG
ncbi:hypothetical protein, partial [Achromobacter ruhlandii]|uniref:hypothetical protein n=1 Tax=Achromobacter ruhlandii TaxID=72557 RepID=UPI0021F14738